MIVIVDAGAGNPGAIKNMVKKAGAEAAISSEAEDLIKAEKLILPGVGAFDYGMTFLQKSGMIPILNNKVLNLKTPILGICLGMQLLTRKSEEGSCPGLGWLDAQTVKFRPGQGGLKIPHMGWASVTVKNENELLRASQHEERFYFAHSYHVQCREPKDVWLTSHYGSDFVSGIRCDNLYGVQFHPEKSHHFGLRLIKNFIDLKP